MARQLGRLAVLVTTVVTVALPTATAQAARPAPRCVVVGPVPHLTRTAPAVVVVGVPRVRCTGREPRPPSGTGSGGGAANGPVGAGSGGALPFTGFEAAAALVSSAVLVSAGALLQRLGRRRAVPGP